MAQKAGQKHPSCITLIRKKGERIGTVEAESADAAIKVAINEYGIDDSDRQRSLAAQRIDSP
jgi:hypothetical protein